MYYATTQKLQVYCTYGPDSRATQLVQGFNFAPKLLEPVECGPIGFMVANGHIVEHNIFGQLRYNTV